MKLPIDVSALQFLVAVGPVPVIDFESKTPRADDNGEPLYTVQLVAMGEGKADILPVKLAGSPGMLGPGTPVEVTGLVATPWSMGDRSGVSFRAASIEAKIPAANGAGEKAGRS